MEMKKSIFFLSLIIISLASTVKKTADLDKELKEISGWVLINDSTLVAHNDGGNKAILYVLSMKGKIINRCTIKDVENIDFEDITYDGKSNIYLGDIGNNENKRKDLAIYKIPTINLRTKEKVTAQKIPFSYPEQKDFPANAKEKYYDAESMAFFKDSLYVFTKCRTDPFDGISKVYQLSTKIATQKAKLVNSLTLGKRGWHFDSCTGAEIFNNELYLLTYNRLMIYSFTPKKIVFKEQINLLPISQKESITVKKNGEMLVADERHKLLGGGNMYLIKRKKK